MSEMLSYGQFLKDRNEFQKSGGIHGNEFNFYDTPSHKYFKILFYFGNMSNNTYGDCNGLLHPTWEVFNKRSEINGGKTSFGLDALQYYDFNSAWSYLKLNDENERAEKLERFVTLLSNINTYSPWYFKSISGLDTALERKATEGESFEIGDRQKITINCMPDAFDNRIGTLLDLYRDITWSWINKKEIIPSNLRKFDMAIYIFESPIEYWHKDSDVLNSSNTAYSPSYKLLEFHDCEFVYNSSKSGYGEINNEAGFTPNYNIEISYNNCYESSYNEILLRQIGDIIETDMYQAVLDDSINSNKKSLESKEQTDNVNALFELSSRQSTNGFVQNAVGQLVGAATSYVKHKIKRAFLGNLYTYSLTQIGSQLDDVLQGNLITAGQSVKQYINNAQERAAAKVKNKPTDNIFKNGNSDTSISNKLKNIFE